MNLGKSILKTAFHKIGLKVVNAKKHLQNQNVQRAVTVERNALLHSINQLEYVFSNARFDSISKNVELQFIQFLNCHLRHSKSQLFQDLFVLFTLNQKRNGFFIEFGATDGENLSNTYLLEKEYGWTGILCEPGKVWQQHLKHNRNCIIDERCVWSESGAELKFNETDISELSTIELFNDSDFHSKTRKNGKTYPVTTVSLNDLLLFHKAPATIDYLSIDTEGSEFEILDAFDFTKHEIKIITVEHNFTSSREKIFHLLRKNGFQKVLSSISAFDDWYIHESFVINKHNFLNIYS